MSGFGDMEGLTHLLQLRSMLNDLKELMPTNGDGSAGTNSGDDDMESLMSNFHFSRLLNKHGPYGMPLEDVVAQLKEAFPEGKAAASEVDDFLAALSLSVGGGSGGSGDACTPEVTSTDPSEDRTPGPSYSPKGKGKERAEPGPSGYNSAHSGKLDREKLTRQCDKYERQLIDNVVEPEDIKETFSDVHVSEGVLDRLMRATNVTVNRPEAFRYGILAQNRISGALLYGPSGTGKTLLAKALTKESKVNMLEITGADILDCRVGESEKMARSVFSLANKISPCIVFIDEADALFGSRKDDDKPYHRTLINQFLREWDRGGAGTDKEATFLLLATNRPSDIDTAVLRRVPVRICIDIPSPKDRVGILNLLLTSEETAMDKEETCRWLAKRTNSYTGSDLRNLCFTAALVCEARAEVDGTYATRKLSKEDFETALADVGATPVKAEEIQNIRRFDRSNRRSKTATKEAR